MRVGRVLKFIQLYCSRADFARTRQQVHFCDRPFLVPALSFSQFKEKMETFQVAASAFENDSV
jgi:hypothetical protein